MEEVYKLYGIKPDAEPIGEGAEATVYPLDDEQVVRVYRRADESQKAKLEVMQGFYESLDTSGVDFDIPKILSINVSGGVVSTVDKRLHGKDFSAVYETLEPQEKQKTLLSYLAAAQQIRHLASPYPYFGEVLSDNPIRETSWRNFLSRKIQLAYEKGQETLSEDVPEIQQVLGFMEEQLSLFDDVERANLVHGDFYVPNVLVENGGVSAVLDFNDLTLAGDYRMDVASAIIFLGDKGTGARDSDRQILIDKLVAEHGEGIKDVIHFYKLYYALVFGSYTKENDPDTYKWAVDTLNQQADNISPTVHFFELHLQYCYGIV